ncbi:LysR family transcriptional regulator [Fuscovulum ytuae]|uniref:LysR family transcriptional regulator n=1 Tax=Fuscovulum ytuae TaxID=3042299 RepID=A0ABY8QA72_9RHOB|nr:LysR family transcriptional regulator [Fuscovulum sp. YMD61]WGV17789.1 LysR family transcriptional regulator [Fuscovulum sp. YMD61]
MTEGQGRVTLWGIEVFLAAAEEGAISTAARRLGVSPSAVSQQLSSLESALGAVLMDRSARPLRMTPAGTMFRRHAQVILNAEAEARAELALADLSGLTTLRLGMIEDLDAEVTPQLLAELATELKGCRFLLETGASHHLQEQLSNRALDMVVAADAPTEVAEGWREVHPLLAEPFLAVAPKGADPADLPLIQYTTRHLMGRQIAAHLARQNMRIGARFELDSYTPILAMVAAGAGWTILTPLALHHAARFRDAVDLRPLPFDALGRTLSLQARAGVLRDMPGEVAVRLRRLLDRQVVQPTRALWPWLGDSLRTL